MVGIVIGVASAIILLVGILWWKGCLRRRDTMRSGILTTKENPFIVMELEVSIVFDVSTP